MDLLIIFYRLIQLLLFYPRFWTCKQLINVDYFSNIERERAYCLAFWESARPLIFCISSSQSRFHSAVLPKFSYKLLPRLYIIQIPSDSYGRWEVAVFMALSACSIAEVSTGHRRFLAWLSNWSDQLDQYLYVYSLYIVHSFPGSGYLGLICSPTKAGRWFLG